MDRIAIAGALVIFICTLCMAYLWLFRKPICEEAAVLQERLDAIEHPRIHNAAIAATAELIRKQNKRKRVKRV